MQEYEDQSQNVRENADPGREYAAPGLEIQREQPCHYTPTPVDQRQSRKNAQREKMLRTLLLSTAVVATAAAATGQLKPTKKFQDAARIAIINMQCERVGDKYELIYTATSKYDPVERPEIPICTKEVPHVHAWVTPNGTASFMNERTLQEWQEWKEKEIEYHVEKSRAEGENEEVVEMRRNEDLEEVNFAWVDEPNDLGGDDVQLMDSEKIESEYKVKRKAGESYTGFEITADKVTEGTTIYMRVTYLEDDGVYEDRYYYQFVGNGRTWTEYHIPAQLAEAENEE